MECVRLEPPWSWNANRTVTLNLRHSDMPDSAAVGRLVDGGPSDAAWEAVQSSGEARRWLTLKEEAAKTRQKASAAAEKAEALEEKRTAALAGDGKGLAKASAEL